MDERQIEALQDAMEEFRKTGELSTETLKKLNDSASPAAKNISNLGNIAKQSASKMAGLGKEIMDGQGSFKSLSGAVGAVTGVLGKLLGAIPMVGGALKGLAEGVGEASKFVLDQLDRMGQNYQALGDASATASDGIDGLQRQFRQMGLVSLPAFTKAVNQNSQGLAIFGVNVAKGAEEFSKVAGALTQGEVAANFLKLGMSMDGVGEAAGNYISAFARYGGLQKNTSLSSAEAQQRLTDSTKKYIEEVDLIARMTGNTRAQQEQEQKKSLVDARFRAKILEMQMNGQEAEAAQLVQYVNGLGGAAGDAARALVTGVPMTEEAANANILFQGQLRDSVIALQGGAKASTEIEKSMRGGAAGVDKFGKLMQYTGTESFGAASLQAMDFAAAIQRANKEGISVEDAAKKNQQELQKATGKSTQEFVDSQVAIAQASKDLQNLGFTLAKFAIPAVNNFATAIQKVTNFVDTNIGGPGEAMTAVEANKAAREQAKAEGKGFFASQWEGMKAGTSATFGVGPRKPGPGSAAGGNANLAGLRIKSGEATAGGDTSPQLAELAQTIQEKLGGNLNYFSAFNDRYHQGLDRNSAHKDGRALDFTLADPSTAANVTALVQSLPGVKTVLNEYAKLSPGATGGHIHAEIQARNGLEAMFKGPDSGYRPNLTMHGDEMMSITPMGGTSGLTTKMDEQSGILAQQLQRMEELVAVMRNQVEVSNKILRVQQ